MRINALLSLSIVSIGCLPPLESDESQPVAAPVTVVQPESAPVPETRNVDDDSTTCDFDRDPRLTTPRGRINIRACRCFNPLREARAVRMASKKDKPEARRRFHAVIHALFNEVSWQTGTPNAILGGGWKTESGVLKGDSGSAGGCNVMKQLDIREKWKPGYGAENIEALKHIAEVTGRDADDIQGSCGNTTLVEKRERGATFGGCIGPMQVTPAEWVADPEFRDKDPFDLCTAALWAGKKLKRHHDAYAEGRSEYEAWQLAIRRYYGSLKHHQSKAYYAHVRDRWADWNAATVVAEP